MADSHFVTYILVILWIQKCVNGEDVLSIKAKTITISPREPYTITCRTIYHKLWLIKNNEYIVNKNCEFNVNSKGYRCSNIYHNAGHIVKLIVLNGEENPTTVNWKCRYDPTRGGRPATREVNITVRNPEFTSTTATPIRQPPTSIASTTNISKQKQFKILPKACFTTQVSTTSGNLPDLTGERKTGSTEERTADSTEEHKTGNTEERTTDSTKERNTDRTKDRITDRTEEYRTEERVTERAEERKTDRTDERKTGSTEERTTDRTDERKIGSTKERTTDRTEERTTDRTEESIGSTAVSLDSRMLIIFFGCQVTLMLAVIIAFGTLVNRKLEVLEKHFKRIAAKLSGIPAIDAQNNESLQETVYEDMGSN